MSASGGRDDRSAVGLAQHLDLGEQARSVSVTRGVDQGGEVRGQSELVRTAPCPVGAAGDGAGVAGCAVFSRSPANQAVAATASA